ncbi:hypothetical protein FHU10_4064 [Serratia fonticola]|jgi:hypothetical protein|uniref:Uncharacterized protein n=1 Tax=Serratia fonticola TaxID=47917 RepID=A0A542D1I9_SERFO|nr:hypothetical protein FHU09_3641 [Serratia fonticola]TQI96941.1 hypothetical protein FHU11_2404 [Serratia fonticola]TVZ71436.1 hypothetical protein FHU10_4064 [Serratia fonticola]
MYSLYFYFHFLTPFPKQAVKSNNQTGHFTFSFQITNNEITLCFEGNIMVKSEIA